MAHPAAVPLLPGPVPVLGRPVGLKRPAQLRGNGRIPAADVLFRSEKGGEPAGDGVGEGEPEVCGGAAEKNRQKEGVKGYEEKPIFSLRKKKTLLPFK